MTDPIEDAWRWLEAALSGRPVPALVVAIGLPDESLLAALERRAPETRVLALEPDAVRARRFPLQPAARRWRASGRLTYLAAPAYQGADDAWRAFPSDPDNHVILVAPSVAQQGGPDALEAARTLKRIVFGARANAEARRQFAPRYLANVLRNAPAIAAGRDVRALTDAYRGQPAIVVAAGPSLDEAIDGLRAASDRALIVAADTTLRPLLAAGVAPHLVVGLDPSERNARHFHALPDCPATWLVSEAALDPAAQRHFGERTFWFTVADHEPWPWLHEMGVDVGLLEVWGSVVTAAFQVARLAGCDPIVFAGADLAYTGGRPYCRGTTYEFDWAASTAAGLELDAIWRTTVDAQTTVAAPDLHGRPARTTPVLLAFRDWLVAHAARSGRRIVNAGDAGVLFAPGIERRPLAEAISAGRPIASPGRAAAASSALRPALAAPLHALREAVAAGTPHPVVERWIAALGPGWQAPSVVAALDEAVQSLTGGEPDTGTPPGVAPRAVILQLPEAVARWRTALAGEPGPALDDSAGGPKDATAALVEALALLIRIVRRLQSDPPVPAPGAAAPARGAVPLSALYDWPAAVAWDVRLVDALLGVAVRGPLTPQASFFTAPVNPREPLPGGDVIHPAVDRAVAIACGRLAMDWAACAATRSGLTETSADPAITAQAVESLLAGAADRPQEPLAATLTLTTIEAGVADSIDLPLPLDGRALARLDTGAWLERRFAGHERQELAGAPLDIGVGEATDSARVSLRVVTPLPSISGARPGLSGGSRLVPRVLTDAGVPRANVAYATTDAVVCVGHHRNESFLVFADGATAIAHEWPRSIVFELPSGTGGLVAWSNGAARWDAPSPGYVMYRPAAGAPVTIDELPFRPGWGGWWRERLHWTCFKTGLGSWAPGVPPALALETTALLILDVDADGLSLVPAVRDEGGRLQRRRAGYTLRCDGDPGEWLTEACGQWGARTAHAIGAHGWRAEAFAESDIVLLAAPDGRAVTMACYYPMKLAWAGPSLLVSTFEGELLLFENVVARLHGGEGPP